MDKELKAMEYRRVGICYDGKPPKLYMFADIDQINREIDELEDVRLRFEKFNKKYGYNKGMR